MGLEALGGVDGHSVELNLLSLLLHVLQSLELGLVESNLGLNWVLDCLGSDKAVVNSSSDLGLGLGLRLGLGVGSSHLDGLSWVCIGVDEDWLGLLLDVSLLMLIALHLLNSISISHSLGSAELEEHDSNCCSSNDQSISEHFIESSSFSTTIFLFFLSQLLIEVL